MCNLCDGTSFEEQLASLRQRFDRVGWTTVAVDGDERKLGWAYTVGMIRSGHAELVVLDEPPEVVSWLFETLAPQISAGRVLTPGTTTELGGRTWAVLEVHPSQVRAGVLAWWPEIFPHCPCHGEPFAVQLIDVDDLPPPGTPGSRRLDQRYEPSGGRRAPRAQRRRQERAEAKRRRQT
jgi:hypothetical protein